MKRVIILAGHNFEKSGCSTQMEDGRTITEFDLTTELVARVFKEERLINLDTVIKARNDFADLVKEVNEIPADYLISCHFNAYDGETQGTEVLYAHTSSKGEKLAKKAQTILVKNLGLNDRGIKGVSPSERGGSILNKTKPIAILIEPFFLDEIHSYERLNALMDKTVESILEILLHIANQ